MKFYEITLRTVPEVIFAYNVETVNYKNTFPHTPDLLEISVCDEGDILQEYEDGGKKYVYAGMLQTIVKDIKMKASCTNSVRQRHTTVGIIAKYDYVLSDTDSAEVNALNQKVKNGIILIPSVLKLGEKYDNISEKIMNISNDFLSINPSDRINAVSKWFSLAGALNDIVLENVSESRRNIPDGTLNYVNKAKKYIKENYKNKLKVAEIAEYSGISSGYLHNVFKAVTGMGIIEYINMYKINMIKQCVKRFEVSLKEAAFMVGVDDPSYMSRLFKKTTGMSFREYAKH